MLRNNGISGSSGFTISTTGNQVEAKKVGFLHSVKAFFGFGNARAENTATLNAIRDAIMNDDKFASGYLKGEKLLGGIKGTITVDKMKTLLSDIQTKSSATEKANSLALAAKARVVASLSNTNPMDKGGPLEFLNEISGDANFKEISKQFRNNYAKSIANAVRATGCTDGNEMKKIVEQCKANIKTMFNNKNKEATMTLVNLLSSCGANPLIKKDADGNVRLRTEDESRIFANGMLNAIDVASAKNKNQVTIAMEMLKNMDNTKPLPFSPTTFGNLIDIGQRTLTTRLGTLLDKYVDTHDKNDLPKPAVVRDELVKLCRSVSEAVDLKAKGLADTDKGKQTLNAIKKAVFQIAISSMPAERETALGLLFIPKVSSLSYTSYTESDLGLGSDTKAALEALKLPLKLDVAVDLENSTLLEDRSTAKIANISEWLPEQPQAV